jgi:hypothetical protein
MKNLLNFEEFLNESISAKSANFFKKYFASGDVAVLDYGRVSPKTICILIGISDPASSEFRQHKMGGRKPSIHKELTNLCKGYGMNFAYQTIDNNFCLSFYSEKNNPSDLLNFIDDVVLPIDPRVGQELKDKIVNV